MTITDQAQTFSLKSSLPFASYLTLKNLRTSAYHSQTDGLCENYNITLKLVLHMTVNSDKYNWDEQFLSALLAYRICKQAMRADYGRDPRIGLDIQ